MHDELGKTDSGGTTMCELFAVSAPEPIRCNQLLKAFFSNGNAHPHGWGMAFFYGNAVSLEKEPRLSLKSDYLKQRLCFDITADQMLAHIRLASKGVMSYENTHPFVERDGRGRAWTLIHNGTIFECDALSPYVHTQKGQTDSERILLYLIDRINAAQDAKGAALSKEERFAVVEDVVAEITIGNNKVNLILYDGTLLYVHSNFQDSLHTCRKGNALIVSTRPLDGDDWKVVPMNTLCAYRRGVLKYTGTDHGHEYFEDEEQLKYLYLDFAAL